MNLHEINQSIMIFIGHNQMWAIVIVFILAFSESLAIISMLVPATAILLATGALIGTGTLPFFPLLFSAALGAVLGDSISYWLGLHYSQKIITSWPLNKHTKAVYRAEQFFHRWGIWSVFIGRFFGPFRAFVPLIAGTMHMPKLKFNVANITSAFIWAFGILAPGTFGIAWLEMIFS